MARGRIKASLLLTESERWDLRQLTIESAGSESLAQRARIVLLSAEGITNLAVAKRLGITNRTVGKWRRRFVDHRAGGLLDTRRPLEL